LHRSPHFGFSQEFAEYRAYNEGDDLRFVDWNVYARTDRTYIKRFRGDTNTSLSLLLDASGSMAYGSVKRGNQDGRGQDGSNTLSKYDFARYLTASLAYLASKQHDANGLVIFDDQIRQVLQASARPDNLARIFATLESNHASAGTDVEGALESLHSIAPRRGLVALISDLYTDPERLLETLQPLVHRQQDIVLFHVLDPMELNPEYDSVVSLVDLESGDRTDVDPDWLKSDYRELIEQHCEALKTAAARTGADYVRLVTNAPLDDALARYLMFRQRKR